MHEQITVTIALDEETRCFFEKFLGARTDKTINKILAIVKELKSMNQQTIQLLSDIDAASNELATDIQVLIDKANTNGSATAEEINAALAPKVAFLKQLAADTNAPVPDVPEPTA